MLDLRFITKFRRRVKMTIRLSLQIRRLSQQEHYRDRMPVTIWPIDQPHGLP